MNTPHKYADVLRAIADGKPVQFSADDNKTCWMDFDPNEYLDAAIKP